MSGQCKKLGVIFLIGILSLAAAGCGSIGPFAPENDLLGAWRFKQDVGGPLVLSFFPDRTYEVDYNGDGMKDIWGNFEIWNNRVKFTDSKPRIITECYEPGFYYFDRSGRDLSFELLADQCRPRRQVLGMTLVRVTKKARKH